MNNHAKIKIGVLGTSRIAKKAAIPAIIDSNFAELSYIGSRSIDSARECALSFHCDTFGLYEDVINSDVDAVYISLPNAMHEEWALQALAAGKHVWCEKPAALTFASAKKMVATAHERNLRLMEGFMFHYHPQHAKIREILQSGRIGDIVGFEGRFAFPLPLPGTNLLNPLLGGGIYNDAVVYPIRASRMIFVEEPLAVECSLVQDSGTGADMSAKMILTYSDNRTAKISGAFDSNYVSTYSVIGTKGTLSLERAYAVPKDMAVKIFVETGSHREEIIVDPADQFRIMIDDFCAEINSGSVDRTFETDLLAQARVVDAGRLSHNKKKTILLSEV